MKLTLKPLTAAILIASAQLSGVAFAEATKTPVAPAVQAAPVVAKAPIAIKYPTDWIIYDDTIFTPVGVVCGTICRVGRRRDAMMQPTCRKDAMTAAHRACEARQAKPGVPPSKNEIQEAGRHDRPGAYGQQYSAATDA
ncbi:MAG: hypothetical protein ACYCY5_01485 [Sulfuricella sp.]